MLKGVGDFPDSASGIGKQMDSLELHMFLASLGVLVWAQARIRFAEVPPTPLRLNVTRICLAHFAAVSLWLPWRASWCTHPVPFTIGMTAVGLGYLWLLVKIRRVWPKLDGRTRMRPY